MSETALTEPRSGLAIPGMVAQALFDTLDRGVLIAERSGGIVMANLRARQILGVDDFRKSGRNQFEVFLHIDPKVIFDQIENGEHEVDLRIDTKEGPARARIQWLPEPDWLVVQFDDSQADSSEQPGAAHGARSAAGTRNHLPESARSISEIARSESSENCFLGVRCARAEDAAGGNQGILRLVAIGLFGQTKREATGHSAGIEGELRSAGAADFDVPQLFGSGERKTRSAAARQRLRDCLNEVAHRWHDSFAHKNVRMDLRIDPSLSTFRFDYQKVQQAVGNLLDNALKHTPAEGCVTLNAESHFWERRSDGRTGTAGQAPI